MAIPDYASLRKNCIGLSHDAPWSVHFGRDKRVELVEKIYWCPNWIKTLLIMYVHAIPANVLKYLVGNPMGSWYH